MSSNDNNQGNDVAFIVAFVGVFAIVWALIIYSLVVFAALVGTLICLVALFTPIDLGQYTIDEEDAGAYITRGLVGGALVIGFLYFLEFAFKANVHWDWFWQFWLGGYAAGSLGIELLRAHVDAQGDAEIIPPEALPPQPPQRSLPNHRAESFRFASWDDEEAGQ